MTKLRLFGGRQWDALTPDELRIVASAMVAASASGRYTIESVFLRLLLDVNHLDVLYGNAIPSEDGTLETIYYVRERRPDALPFAMPLYALQYWAKPRKEGGGGAIDWLMAGSQRTRSPEVPHKCRGFAPPADRMADVTWQQYRAMTDYFEQFVKIEAAVRRAKEAIQANPDTAASTVDGNSLAGQRGDRLLAQARAQWLATIFVRRTFHRDRQRGVLTYSFAYRPGQARRYERHFMHVSPVDFQLILLWWEGMQNYLRHRYPKCFKKGTPVGNDKQDPLSLYSRSIATLEKFTGSDEETINQKTYSVVLQQFNDMVEQNEEYERMRNS